MKNCFTFCIVLSLCALHSCVGEQRTEAEMPVWEELVTEYLDQELACNCGEIDWLGEVEDGLVYVSRGKCDYYLSELGEPVFQDTFYSAQNFKGDYAAVQLQNSKYPWVIIDRSGEVILSIEENYDGVSMMWGWKYPHVEQGDLNGVLNLEGEFVIELQPLSIYVYGDFAMLDDQMKRTQIYDLRNGELLGDYEGQFGGYSEGYFSVMPLFSGYYVDTLGERVFSTYDFAADFSEGLAKVTVNEKTGFINQKGEFEIPLIFDGSCYDNLLAEFSNGCCVMSTTDDLGNTKEGFINRKGELIVPYIYDEVYDFENGLARVVLNDKMGVINTKGEELFFSDYDYLFVVEEDFYYTFTKTGYLFLNNKGESYEVVANNCSGFYNGSALFSHNDEIFAMTITAIKSKLRQTFI